MKGRATALDRVLVALDRDLVRAVVRVLDRARDVSPVSARDLPRELELVRDLSRELELARDLARELELARAGNARELANALELVRALELALARDLEPAHAAVLDTAEGSALDLELKLEDDLDVAFVRAPAFVRALALARILNRVRALVRALVRARDFVATYEDERAFGRGARVMLGRAMGALIALAVQVLPASRQLRHLEEFCAELLELRWWQWPWHALCILLHVGGLRRALNEAVGTPEGALARRAQR